MAVTAGLVVAVTVAVLAVNEPMIAANPAVAADVAGFIVGAAIAVMPVPTGPVIAFTVALLAVGEPVAVLANPVDTALVAILPVVAAVTASPAVTSTVADFTVSAAVAVMPVPTGPVIVFAALLAVGELVAALARLAVTAQCPS
ncbi:hypothetical protein L914_01809 [Phytophthora nicotianae]|uniref:Uncharacterized protein n=1 Tax=Phytophthora nicotianae TaxID=4792 RepID=W2P262_PHYNI|nr:hypothetical protein L914_01809 [Phytophthora nicotianae]